jgi:hypothetical protein
VTRQEYEFRIARLKSRYPYLFACEHLGHDFAPGWLGILEKLCAQIDGALSESEKPKVHVVQIKEKFGGLRVYLNVAPLRVDIFGGGGRIVSGEVWANAGHNVFSRLSPFVKAAEKQSCETCIFCSAPGSIRGDDWLLAVCDKHAHSTRRDLEEHFEDVTTP